MLIGHCNVWLEMSAHFQLLRLVLRTAAIGGSLASAMTGSSDVLRGTPKHSENQRVLDEDRDEAYTGQALTSN